MKEHLEPKNKPEHLSALEGIEDLAAQTKSAGGTTLAEFLLSPENKEVFKYKKIIVGGPAHSGKTVFNRSLKEAIKSIPGAPYPFIYTVTPDGEISAHIELVNNYPELAAEFKAKYKGTFTQKYIDFQIDAIKNLGDESCPLNFIDLGGMITPANLKTAAEANAAIILCGENELKGNKGAEWKEFFNNAGIPVIAEFYSDFEGKDDVIVGVGEDGVFRASIHHLDRNVDVNELNSRPAIKAFAKYVLSFEKQGYPEEADVNTELVEDNSREVVSTRETGRYYLMHMEQGGVLRCRLGEATTSGGKIVEDADLGVKSLIESGEIKKGDFIKINGGITVAVSEAMGIELSKIVDTLALFVPQMRGKEKIGEFCVVTFSKNSKYNVGDIIELRDREGNVVPSFQEMERKSDSFEGDINVDSIGNNDTEKTQKQEIGRYYPMHMGKGGVLECGFGELATGEKIVKDSVLGIRQLIERGEIKNGDLVKIDGRITAAAANAMGIELSKVVETLALFVPQMKDEERIGMVCVVTFSKNPKYKIGEVIELRGRDGNEVSSIEEMK